MCGICAILRIYKNGRGTVDTELEARTQNASSVDEVGILSSRLVHRGPDIQNIEEQVLNSGVNAMLCGCTLHFRGKPTQQPLHDSVGNMLLWNGEIFGGIRTRGENDGLTLLNQLEQCRSHVSVLSTISKIRGPWAMIYYQTGTQTLWFGRDVFGRRSLLLHLAPDGATFALASVQLKHLKPWTELPAKGIYCMDISKVQTDLAAWEDKVEMYPWLPNDTQGGSLPGVAENSIQHEPILLSLDPDHEILVKCGALGVISNITPFNRDLKDPRTSLQVEAVDATCVTPSTASVTSSSQTMSSPVLLAAPVISTESVTSSASPVTSSTAPVTSSTLAVTSSVAVLSSPASVTSSQEAVDILMAASEEQIRLADRLIEVLGEAVRVRVQEQADVCDKCLRKRLLALSSDRTGARKDSHFADIKMPRDFLKGTQGTGCSTERDVDGKVGCGHARVAVLFSGGIDSLVLTALADRFVPVGEPIDLLNVAFEQKCTQAPNSKNHKGKHSEPFINHSSIEVTYDVPDRITGRHGARLLNPERPWNFIEVNVTAEGLQQARTEHVQDLVYPLQTVLDDSIGCAVWFAASGKGEIIRFNSPNATREPYTSTARVVLVGMGADEQLAGYSRHRVKYNTGGMEGLMEEINMEINRISARNLGRDDRIITDHGKESRFPFLDENVVSFLNALPVYKKADLQLPRGIGEKLLLRVAAVKLGLGPSATLPKRAIQFGSRIAKLENSKEKASDVCTRLQQL